MPAVQPFAPGNYRFLTHAFQYSGGVAAEPGFAIERARFARPLPLAAGFDAIEAYLARLGRPPTAFCACELRSPRQFTEQGFIDFNRHYVQRLEKWGIFRDDINPVARSNVCPEIDPPSEPSSLADRREAPSTITFTMTDMASRKVLGTCQSQVVPDVKYNATTTVTCSIDNVTAQQSNAASVTAVPDNPGRG